MQLSALYNKINQQTPTADPTVEANIFTTVIASNAMTGIQREDIS